MADPAQVGFSHDGTVLVVTEKAGNRLNSWTVDADGLPVMRIGTPSAGMTPFGFAFTNSDYLIVSEAFGGMPGASAVSSYDGMTANLTLISGSVPNGQTAACWVVVTNSGRLAFVSNTGSDTISSYGISDSGSLSLVDATAANTGMGSAPIDMTLSNNSRFLYVLENGDHVVRAWSVTKDGGLQSIGSFGMLRPGSQGIAAK